MNLLTDTWEVAGWVLGVPWVVAAGLGIGLFFSIRSGIWWMVCSNIHKSIALKAEAEVRELQTALDERLNKLRAADFRCGELERKVNLLEAPRTGKNGSASPLSTHHVLGNPAKNGGKARVEAVTKKIAKSVAKRKIGK